MAHHHRALYAELLDRLVEQVRLPVGRPHAALRPFAVAEPRTVEDDDPLVLKKQVRQPAGVVVVSCHRVPMDKDDGAAPSAVAVMEADAVHLQERALGRMAPLGPACHEMVDDGHGGDGGRACSQGFADRRRSA